MDILQEDAKLFDELIDGSAYGAAVVAPDGTWLRANAYLFEMFGYEEDELLGMTFQQLTHPEDLLSEAPYLKRLTAGEIDHYRFKKRYLHKNGGIVWGLLDRAVVRDAEGNLRFYVSQIRDITAEKNAEPKPTLISKLAARLQDLWQRR